MKIILLLILGTLAIQAQPVSSSNVLRCSKYTIGFGHTAFKAAAATIPITLFALPARSKIIGVNIKHSTAFAGTGITSTTVSVGDGNTPFNQYGAAFNIFQAASNTTYQDTAQFKSTTTAASNVVGYFTFNTNAGNGTVTVLTAGSVGLTVCWVPLP